MFLKSFTASFAAVVFALFTFAGTAWAVVEVNGADASQLETIKGIGPALSGKILNERKQGNFKDWSDFETRVSGVGEKNAAGFSRAGLTVSGKPKDGSPAGPVTASGKTASKKPVADGATTSLAKK